MKEYREGIVNAIKILDDEIQRLREYRESLTTDVGKVRVNELILSHILSIQQLREVALDEKEEE